MAKNKRVDWKGKYTEAQSKLDVIGNYQEKQDDLDKRLVKVEKDNKRLTPLKILSILSIVISLITGCIVAYYTREQTGILEKQTLLLENQDTLLSRQNILFKHQNVRIDQQTNLQEAGRRSSLIFLFNNVLDKIDEELKNSANIGRELSPELIGRISALSYALKPYKYLSHDSIIPEAVSPERGQLLLSLVNSRLGRKTLFKIFETANFRNSEIRDANFSKQTFKGLDLSFALIEKVDFTNTSFDNVTFERASLKGCILKGCRFNDCLIAKSDLSGVKANKSTYHDCLFYDVQFSNANLSNAVFSSSLEAKVYFGSRGLFEKVEKEKEGYERLQEFFYDFNMLLGRTQYYRTPKTSLIHQVEHRPSKNYMMGSEVLRLVDFENSVISGAEFRNVVLDKVNFKGAEMYDIMFKGVVLDSTYFTGVKMDKGSFVRNFFHEQEAFSISKYYDLVFDQQNDLIDIRENQGIDKKETEARFNIITLKKEYDTYNNNIRYGYHGYDTIWVEPTRFSNPASMNLQSAPHLIP